jgi:hypothetical protein
MILIPLCGMRRDRVGSKLARHILNGVLIVGEVELSGHTLSLNRGMAQIGIANLLVVRATKIDYAGRGAKARVVAGLGRFCR